MTRLGDWLIGFSLGVTLSVCLFVFWKNPVDNDEVFGKSSIQIQYEKNGDIHITTDGGRNWAVYKRPREEFMQNTWGSETNALRKSYQEFKKEKNHVDQ